MTLQSGTQLGPYTIRAPLGAGGMGEVYAAQDTRLNRTVAIKILPEHLSSNAELRQRFQREAQAISSLNHPKICTLLDIGEQDGLHYLVLEHLEGQTLAQRIRKGPIAVPEALSLAAEMAEALAAAHSRGLVHRDLKPGNVMLTSNGLKLLDFGLARSFQDSFGDLSEAPTATSPLTAAGSVIGTLQYMAPEQIEGKETDARSDIFSFGAVLYEMLTGRRAFPGDSQSAIIAAILKEDPVPVQESVPAAQMAQRCLSRCLARDPDDRWQSARDLMHELRWLADQPPTLGNATNGSRPASKRGSWSFVAAMCTVALLLGLVAGWVLFASRDVGSETTIHAELNLAEGTRLNGWASPVVAISRDGSAIAYVADGPDGISRLYVRHIDSSKSVLVPESDTAEGPFFSPDGQWIGFAVGVSARSGRAGELLKYSIDTGLTQSLAPLEDYFGADWGDDGEILFVEVFHEGFWKIPAAGGTPRHVVSTFKSNGVESNRSVVFPRILPDGRSALVTNLDSALEKLAIVDLETGEYTELGINGIRAFVVDNDQYFYVDREGTLSRMNLDPARPTTTSAGVAVLDGIARSRFFTPVLDISDNGTLVYCSGFLRDSRVMPSELLHIDAAGTETVLPFGPQLIFRGISASPTGDRLVASLLDGLIWIYDVERGTRTKLPATPGGMPPWSVVWSPDGQAIASSSIGSATSYLFRQSTNATSNPILTLEVEDVELQVGSWTPDSQGIIYVEDPLGKPSSIRLKSLQEGATPEVLIDGLDLVYSPRISPDGRWLAYEAADTGSFEIYVHGLAESSNRIVISSGGGRNPTWSQDGRELYYHNPGQIMAVSVPQSPGDRFGRPRNVVETDVEPIFCLDAKGGFFGYRPVPGVGIQKSLNLITNWKELRQ